MAKSLLYRLFKAGALPIEARRVLESEGEVISDEGMPGWLIMNDVKGPGRRYVKRREKFTGSLAISRRRIMCYTFRKRQMNIACDDPSLSRLRVDTPEPGVLSISFDSEVFRPGWQGVIEFRFVTPKAERFREILQSLGASASCRG